MIKTKGMGGKPISTEALYGYVKDPNNKDYWLIDEEDSSVIRLIYNLFIDSKNTVVMLLILRLRSTTGIEN